MPDIFEQQERELLRLQGEVEQLLGALVESEIMLLNAEERIMQANIILRNVLAPDADPDVLQMDLSINILELAALLSKPMRASRPCNLARATSRHSSVTATRGSRAFSAVYTTMITMPCWRTRQIARG